MEPVVDLRSTVAMLDRFPALAGVDLTIDQGEIVHLQGRNGAGKTTLLRLCAGLQRVESGDAVVLGVDLAVNRKAVRPMVGLLGHDTFLYDDLTVLDNVTFWTRATRSDTGSIEQALASVGLEQRLEDLPVRGLSAGQRRRVSMASMIVRQPSLWLLDEPHAGLDSAGRDMVDSLVRTAAASGATVMFASHELDRAHELATTTVQIDGGTVVP